MAWRLDKLAQYLRGWTGYFGISQYYRAIPDLDDWLRRRVRMCYWKRWRWVRTKVRNLLALGTGKRAAILTAMSSKSYWHLSRTSGRQGLGQYPCALDESAGLLPDDDVCFSFLNRPVRTCMPGGVGGAG